MTKEEKKNGIGWWKKLVFRGVGVVGGASAITGCELMRFPPPEPMTAYDDVAAPDATEEELAEEEAVDPAVDWSLPRSRFLRFFPGATATDVDHGQQWRTALEDLTDAFKPTDKRLRPFYVPTLFQSMSDDANKELKGRIQPIITPEMQRSFARGKAVAQVMAQAGWPKDTALVVDLPGTMAVAFAAALADHYAPVFTFDNGPHPQGIVPSHQTVAAALFYAPIFLRADTERPNGSPPLFVLDSNRLLPYVDEDNQFDNRYVAKLPDIVALRPLGIRHIFYVTPDASRGIELDDLNDSFVSLYEEGIDFKILALTDFQETAEPEARLFGQEPCLEDGTCYAYGGDPLIQASFWDYFNWYAGASGRVGFAWSSPPHRCSRGYLYVPCERPTMFRSALARDLGSVRAPISSLTGPSHSPFASMLRSGSFGRFHGSAITG
jgi:hypothetical protein